MHLCIAIPFFNSKLKNCPSPMQEKQPVSSEEMIQSIFGQFLELFIPPKEFKVEFGSSFSLFRIDEQYDEVEL